MSEVPFAALGTTLLFSAGVFWKATNLRGDYAKRWRGRELTVAALEQEALERLRDLYGDMSKVETLTAPDVDADSFREAAQEYLRPLNDRDVLLRKFQLLLNSGIIMMAGSGLFLLGTGMHTARRAGVSPLDPTKGSATLLLVVGLLVGLVGLIIRLTSEHRMVGIETSAGRYPDDAID